MLREQGRRALLLSRTSPLRKLMQSQVPIHETLNPTLQFDEYAFRFLHFSSWVIERSQLSQSFRFFSSSASEDCEDSLTESFVKESGEDHDSFDFSSATVSDENERFDFSGFGNENSDFGETADDFRVSDGFDGKFDEGMGGEFVSVANKNENESESVEQVEENDQEVVEGLLSLLQSRGTVTGSLETNFEKMDLILNEQLLLKVIETPFTPGENLLCFVQWALRSLDYKGTGRVLETLVKVMSQENSKRNAYALWDLVNEVVEKEPVLIRTDCLNGLIALFSKLGQGKAALDAFNKLGELGCHLNPDSYYFTIEALCRSSSFDLAVTICEKMLNADQLPTGKRVGNIILYLCKGDKAKDAHRLYLYAKDKKQYPPRSSIVFLISSLSHIVKNGKGTQRTIDKELDKGTVSLALEMLGNFSAEDRKYAGKPFLCVLNKLCWIEDIDGAKKLLLEMIDAGPPPGNSAFNCVINGLTKVGDTDEALKMMKMMESRGLKPDVYTYSVIMSGYARGGAMEKACEVFDEAKKKHSTLTPVTFHTLICGFCRLEQFDKAVDMLRAMKQYGVKPNHDEYNKLIKALCFKALDWETAEKLETEMQEDGLILNGRTRALINAVRELKEEAVHEVPTPA